MAVQGPLHLPGSQPNLESQPPEQHGQPASVPSAGVCQLSGQHLQETALISPGDTALLPVRSDHGMEARSRTARMRSAYSALTIPQD